MLIHTSAAGWSERCEILFLLQLVQGLFERVKTKFGVRS